MADGGERKDASTGCGGCAAAPVLAAVGTVAGTVWTVRSWADCPLGNSASNQLGLNMLIPVVWLCMTLLLILLQLALWRVHLPGGRPVAWLALLTGAVALTLLYRWGMGWPYTPSGGACLDGYPLFPFTGKM
ncbi:hypothetical protein ABZ990_17235 [Streptomyces sp. NPDC046203]|uniref:hypothetical protein n=1 Tax=Streptomyces sp. NPDC046203 TaxID=3154602 RepID=UPI0033D7E81E